MDIRLLYIQKKLYFVTDSLKDKTKRDFGFKLSNIK